MSRLSILGALVVMVVAGCAFDAQIIVRFDGTSPTVVTESIKPEQSPERMAGVTRRNGQVVGIDCAVTLFYDVREATGSTVLAQTYVVKLRTRRLRRGTRYRLDCLGPLIVELPARATVEAATAASASGKQITLPIRAPLRSLPLARGKRLRAEPGTQLASVGWEPTLPGGDYTLQLTLSWPDAQPIRERIVSTASVSCGRSSYLQPILPPVTKLARVPALTIRRTADAVTLLLPRVASGISSYSETKRTLSCAG